ncbi:MAG: DUF444 family protein [Firmicutes bacterium]|nr:DUF444 family protein [Bacillota bacterium]
MNGRFSVSSDTSQNASGALGDRRRHQRKVDEAIRQHLADMVSDREIVMSEPRRTLVVPVPELKQFRIRFDTGSDASVGHYGHEGDKAEGREAGGSHRGKEGGDQPGSDVEETDVSMEEVERAVFSQLELPNWDATKRARGAGTEYSPVSIARHGIMAHFEAKRTLKAALLRRALSHHRQWTIWPEDLRFRVIDPVPSEEGGAVLIAMMDTSGSMGTFEKYLAKSFFYWTTEFLRQKYPFVELVFLAHDVRAREVDEETFFHRGASGGTVSSSVYRLALEIVDNRYPLERFNIYAFHFTDGGNLTSDNAVAVQTGKHLKERVTLFGYGEIHDTERNPSPLYQEFSQVPGLGVVILRSKDDIFRAMTQFFGKSQEVRGA